jgi:hypothetical protein
LVTEDPGFVDIDDQGRAEKSIQMADGVSRKRRATMPKDVAFQILVRDFFQRADALFAAILDAIEAVFEFPSPILFGELGDRLRCRLRGFLNPPSREPELVPPDIASLENGNRAAR